MIGLLCFALAVLAFPFKSRLRFEAENAALSSARSRTNQLHAARVEYSQLCPQCLTKDIRDSCPLCCDAEVGSPGPQAALCSAC
jgi:hypothetical protein